MTSVLRTVPSVLRTPDERFADLPGYPFEPRYVDVGDPPLRMHYAEAGPADGPVALLLHGQPTWSYLYRHVLAELADRGVRAIAPDLVGYGRSDKPAARTSYTMRSHIGWLTDFVTALDLTDVTLLAQDWGGPIGLGTLARVPERFGRVVAANTVLHTADPSLAGRLTWAVHGVDGDRVVLQEALLDYVLMSLRQPSLVPSVLVAFATSTTLPPEVLAAYDAPFPDETFKAGPRAMPRLVPTAPDDPGAIGNQKAWQVLPTLDVPFLCAFSDGDPITAGGSEHFAARMPGAAGRNHPTIEGAGHFLQEDAGEELGRVVAEFVHAG